MKACIVVGLLVLVAAGLAGCGGVPVAEPVDAPVVVTDEEESTMDVTIKVVSIWAEDVPTTAHFYRDVVGLQLMAHHGEQPYFDLGGTYLTILKGRPVPAQDPVPPRFPIVAFAVPDLDVAVDRLRANQVELPWGVEENETGRWVMLYDPAGNLIELAEFKHAAH
jgi:catechol 2,3-dioxygenase-like lactoylglutathione lyase family enzyme